MYWKWNMANIGQFGPIFTTKLYQNADIDPKMMNNSIMLPMGGPLTVIQCTKVILVKLIRKNRPEMTQICQILI